MTDYPHKCGFCGVPYRVYSADEGTQSPDSHYHALQAENARLRAALKDIVDPVLKMQREAEKDGCNLNGAMAVMLSENAGYLKEIARKALKGRE